jgi:hypothetical protein
MTHSRNSERPSPRSARASFAMRPITTTATGLSSPKRSPVAATSSGTFRCYRRRDSRNSPFPEHRGGRPPSPIAHVRSESNPTLNQIWEEDREVPLALRELESTIHAARLDVAPDEDEWGRLGAAEFLLDFRDVTSWSFTNFQPFPAPPAAPTAKGQRSIAHLASFQWGHRRHLPWDHRRGATQIHTVFDPSVRRGALWAAHALMAVRHPRDPRDRRAHCLRERHRKLFRYENAESMAWLVACARHWPRDYVQDPWEGMAELRNRL